MRCRVSTKLRRAGSGAWRLMRRAIDRGVTYLDTADIYGLGGGEELVAEALFPYPADVAIGTQAGHEFRALRPGERRLPPNRRPERLAAQCE